MEPHNFLRWRLVEVCRKTHHGDLKNIPLKSILFFMTTLGTRRESMYADDVLIFAKQLGKMSKKNRREFLVRNGHRTPETGQVTISHGPGAGLLPSPLPAPQQRSALEDRTQHANTPDFRPPLNPVPSGPKVFPQHRNTSGFRPALKPARFGSESGLKDGGSQRVTAGDGATPQQGSLGVVASLLRPLDNLPKDAPGESRGLRPWVNTNPTAGVRTLESITVDISSAAESSLRPPTPRLARKTNVERGSSRWTGGPHGRTSQPQEPVKSPFVPPEKSSGGNIWKPGTPAKGRHGGPDERSGTKSTPRSCDRQGSSSRNGKRAHDQLSPTPESNGSASRRRRAEGHSPTPARGAFDRRW